MQQHYIVENVKMLEMSTSQHVNAATKQASSYSENNCSKWMTSDKEFAQRHDNKTKPTGTPG